MEAKAIKALEAMPMSMAYRQAKAQIADVATAVAPAPSVAPKWRTSGSYADICKTRPDMKPQSLPRKPLVNDQAPASQPPPSVAAEKSPPPQPEVMDQEQGDSDHLQMSEGDDQLSVTSEAAAGKSTVPHEQARPQVPSKTKRKKRNRSKPNRNAGEDKKETKKPSMGVANNDTAKLLVSLQTQVANLCATVQAMANEIACLKKPVLTAGVDTVERMDTGIAASHSGNTARGATGPMWVETIIGILQKHADPKVAGLIGMLLSNQAYVSPASHDGSK